MQIVVTVNYAGPHLLRLVGKEKIFEVMGARVKRALKVSTWMACVKGF